MIYVTPEGENTNKTGIHFYPLDDKASIGFRLTKRNSFQKHFRWSKKLKSFVFDRVKYD